MPSVLYYSTNFEEWAYMWIHKLSTKDPIQMANTVYSQRWHGPNCHGYYKSLSYPVYTDQWILYAWEHIRHIFWRYCQDNLVHIFFFFSLFFLISLALLSFLFFNGIEWRSFIRWYRLKWAELIRDSKDQNYDFWIIKYNELWSLNSTEE